MEMDTLRTEALDALALADTEEPQDTQEVVLPTEEENISNIEADCQPRGFTLSDFEQDGCD
jgi:hypothetical protein